jgi:hypothetical protein
MQMIARTLLKQQLAESEAAIRSAKEQTSSLSLHVDKASEVLKDHETILRNSLRSIVDNAKREAEQIGVQLLHSSQSLRSDLVERGSALTNLNSRLEYLSSVSSPVQRLGIAACYNCARCSMPSVAADGCNAECHDRAGRMLFPNHDLRARIQQRQARMGGSGGSGW